MLNKKNKMMRSISVISSSLVLMTAFQNCGQAGQITEASLEEIASNPVIPAEPPLDSVTQFTDYSKMVNVSSGRDKIDILVVVDNSGSMAAEQSSMANRFNTLIDQLAGLDWRIAITTTEVNIDGNSGRNRADGQILQFSNNIHFISSSDDMNLARQQFASTIQRSESGSSSEQGIFASYRAMERSKEVGSINSTFIRSDAALSIVVVSDANETPFGGVFTDRNSPMKFIEYMGSSFTGKPFSFHSIIVKRDDVDCLNLADSKNEGYGLFYQDLSIRTGGIVGSVCDVDYGTQLKLIGQASADLVKNVSLDCSPVDADRNGILDVKITDVANPAAVIPSYTVNGNQLQFSVGLSASQYKIDYRCAAMAGAAQ